jgi:DNA-binding CsgD family transcriptional regulator
VGTYRDIELTTDHPFTAVLSELMRARSTTRTVLVGLDDRDVGQVIEAMTGTAFPSDVATLVRDRTEGNPLYVREVARLLSAEGRVPEAGERLAIPKDVRETVLRRLHGLPEDCFEIISLAAVVGREVSLELLTELRGPHAVELIGPAVQAGLVTVGTTPETVGRLRFSHAVVSEALYDAIAPSRRLGLHRDVADAFERLHAADTDAYLTTLAHHYVSALPLVPADKAVDAARRAAERAVRSLAYEEGVRLYRMALTAASGTDDPAVHVELLLGMGDAQSRAGDPAGSRSSFLAAAERARDHGLAIPFAEATLGYGGRFVWMRAADDTRLVPLLQEALRTLPAGEDMLRVRLLARVAGAMRDQPQRAPRDALSLQAVRIAETLDDPEVLAYALGARFTAIWGPDTGDELRRLAAEASASAEKSGDIERVGDALWLRFLADMMHGDTDGPRHFARHYQDLSEELRHPAMRWYGGVMEQVVALMEGRLAQAEHVIEATRELGRGSRPWDAEASYWLALSFLRWEQGRLGEIESDLTTALAAFPGYRVFRCILALLYLESKREDEARDAVREILAGGEEALPYGNDWLAGMTILAEIATRLEMIDVAAEIYDAIVPYAHLVGYAGGEPITGSMHRPLGQLAFLLGRPDDAERHLESAIQMHERMHAELWIAHTEVDLAIVLLARGDAAAAERADHMLTRAMHRCQTLGMVALARRIDEIRGGGALASPDRPGGLTKRELEVATLVASGASNRAIAEALFISERTAETHVQNILTKLGFGARSQIAAWAVEHGLLAGDSSAT